MTRNEGFVLFAVLFAAVALILGLVVYDYRHPCVRRGAAKMCQAGHCIVHMDVGGVDVCTAYDTYEYDCTPCLERKS